MAGLTNGGLGGLFGGNTCSGAGTDYPTAYQVAQKECEDNLALTRSIYETRIQDKDEKFQLYTLLGNRINELEKSQATVNAQLPLMFQLANVTGERYTDDKVAAQRDYQTNVNFVFQRELDKKINGTIGLPWSDIISGIPVMPQCSMAVNCPTTSTAS